VYENNSGEAGIDIVKKALPFGKNTPDSTDLEQPANDGNNNGSGFVIDENGERILPKIFQLHKASIAGAYPLLRKTPNNAENVFVRYLERGVGHIYETNLSTLKEKRISNTTRLKIYEALWGESGDSVIIRYLDDKDEETIRSFLIKLGMISAEEQIPGEIVSQPKDIETEGLFLPENIKNMVISQDSKKVFYLIDTGNRVLGTIYDMESGKSRQIFRSPLTEWLPQWPDKNTITLTTKPSGEVPGFMYFLDVEKETESKMLGGISGLTTLTSPDENNILYSESGSGLFTLNIYKTEEKLVQTLPLITLPEKCVWSVLDTNIIYCAVPTAIPSDTYPDSWYQGLVSFSDEIWALDIITFSTELIASPTELAREEIDAINLSLDPKEEYLFFTNKKDLSLWRVRLRD